MVSVVFLLTGAMVSCSDKNDEPKGPEDQVKVSPSDLAHEWTLVKNIVFHSEADSSEEDETIDYSGNSYPRYRFYEVNVIDDSILSWQEKNANGISIGNPMEFTLDGDNLIDSEGNISGKVERYDASHTWDNLRIKWYPNTPMNNYGVACMSYYMLKNY